MSRSQPKKSILVTGCSDGGLGSALALALQSKGWRVIASARNLSKLQDVKAAGLETVELDIGSNDSIAASVKEVEKLTGGSLDALVNNAGMGYSMPLLDVDMTQMHQLFDMNVFSLIRVTKAYLPLLLKSTTKTPLVANNTSGYAIVGTCIPFQSAYGASKAAAGSITDSMRKELAPFGVRVVNLLTGSIKTTFFANAGKDSRAKLPEDSIYNLAKDAIEPLMVGEDPSAKRSDPYEWAAQVAGDLSLPKPPFNIYRGAAAGMARVVGHLPTGTIDGMFKKMSGIDVLEKRIAENGGLEEYKKQM